MTPTITLAHIERLGFTVNRYDTARQEWADRPTEGNAAIVEAMRAAVEVRAVLCGMPDGVEAVAWANGLLGRFWGAVQPFEVAIAQHRQLMGTMFGGSVR